MNFFFFDRRLKFKRPGRLTICIVRLGLLVYQKRGRLACAFSKEKRRLPAPMVWAIYILFAKFSISSDQLIIIQIGRLL